MRRRLGAIVLVIGLSPLLVGWFGWSEPKPYLNGIDQNGAQVYGAEVPIERTYAYEQFVLSRRTEEDILSYLLSRLHSLQAKDYHFYLRGGRYDWRETYLGVRWVFHRWYKKDTDARTFIRKQFHYFAIPRKPLLIEFPDGEIHRALAIAFNELDLLETTIAKDASL